MPALAYLESPRKHGVTGENTLLSPSGNFPGIYYVRNALSLEIPQSPRWSPDLSASLYNVNGWGAPYFLVNSSGNISIRPFGDETLACQEIDLMKVVKKVSEPKESGGLGLQLPLIVRFPDVLKHRLQSLQSAFEVAIRSQAYDSHYQGLYPVKCNQDRFIVEDIVEYGAPHRFGLEAGSKPELLLAMSCLCKGSPDAFLICNGYKDPEYISLALTARKMNLNTMIVLEQEEELDLILNISQNLGIRPVIGLRAKLRTNHSGHFGSTSGEKGKFGLTTMQILCVAKKLEQAGMLDCLQLLHFHIGSQIPTTSLLSDGVSEATQIYCELVRLGASMQVIDVGGGLGIDYDGTKSSDSDVSVAYTLEEYASEVVKAVRSVCDRKFVKHPVICSESGRALVSHHSVLIFEAISTSDSTKSPLLADLGNHFRWLVDEARTDYRNLMTAAVRGEYDTCLIYAEQLKRRCIDQFKEGSFGLEHLAAVDSLCEMIVKAIGASDVVRKYHVNLSLFTSVPDFWAIGQLFPILPIHKLEQRPRAKGVLLDLTCDSDGKVDSFIGGGSSLPLHEMDAPGDNNSGGYFLGMFLGGAYQEALGGLHNLFGGPNVVRVYSDGGQNFAVKGVIVGQSCEDVLKAMQYEPQIMFQTLKDRAESCHLDVNALGLRIEKSFQSMPYLSDNYFSYENGNDKNLTREEAELAAAEGWN